MTESVEEKKAPKRPRIMVKKIEDGILTITVNGAAGKFPPFDPKMYPEDVKKQFPVIALSHILGDSAAGDKGEDAFESIQAKHKAMLAGNMTMRKPKAPTVKQSEILDNFTKLSDKEKKVALPFLEKLGIVLPG